MKYKILLSSVFLGLFSLNAYSQRVSSEEHSEPDSALTMKNKTSILKRSLGKRVSKPQIIKNASQSTRSLKNNLKNKKNLLQNVEKRPESQTFLPVKTRKTRFHTSTPY